MKTQIIKIIPCLLAGFILSACVGAVNIPSSVADKGVKTTEPDPVVKKDTIVIVDDKEPEPEPEPKPEPEPEPEPIVIDPEIALINICIMDDNGGDASCEPTVKNHPCIRDPFGGVCHIQFADYYETAQANRIAFCIIEENAYKSLCSGANIAMNNCIKDPFADKCKIQTGFTDYYQTAVGNRIAHCQDDYESRTYHGTPDSCKNVCNINGDPFGKMCSDNEHVRTQKYTFCEMAINANDASCVGVFSRPNVLTFLRSFSTPLPTKPNAENPESEFLQGTETGLNVGDFNTNNGTVKTLNFTDFSLDEDSADGVAFFVYGGNYYAGILSGTDLGAPVTEKTGTAHWDGFFRTVGPNLFYRRNEQVGQLIRTFYIDTSVYESFTLTVNFGAGDQAGTISGSVDFSSDYNSYNKGGEYSLNGSFNDNGLITGNVTRSTTSVSVGRVTTLKSNATLTGLIGQEGAVGIFISDEKESSGYSGGFVARPPDE